MTAQLLEVSIRSRNGSVSQGMRGQWSNDQGKQQMSTPPPPPVLFPPLPFVGADVFFFGLHLSTQQLALTGWKGSSPATVTCAASRRAGNVAGKAAAASRA